MSQLQEYQDFLTEVLEATAESKGDRDVLYPLLERNLDKLDDVFIRVLEDWGKTLVKLESEQANDFAAAIVELSVLIQQFYLGNRLNNLEIVIAGYKQALLVYTREDFLLDWARIQNNLGIAYRNRIKEDKGENIEKAIACYQQALLVFTREDFPLLWAMTQNNLGIAYWERIKEDKGENIEKAIACYQQALLVYTREDFPLLWAMTQNNLGNVYCDRIKEDKAENLEKAIACYQQALLVFTREDFPLL